MDLPIAHGSGLPDEPGCAVTCHRDEVRGVGLIVADALVVKIDESSLDGCFVQVG